MSANNVIDFVAARNRILGGREKLKTVKETATKQAAKDQELIKDFRNFYVLNYPVVNTILAQLLANVFSQYGIDRISKQDMMMLRECVFSFIMREKGIHHPFHRMAVEIYKMAESSPLIPPEPPSVA